MPVTLIATRLPADATQRELLKVLFGSPGFQLLKEMVASHAVDSQIEAMNRAINPSESNNEIGSSAMQKAIQFGFCRDLLDDIGTKDQMWFTVRVDQRK